MSKKTTEYSSPIAGMHLKMCLKDKMSMLARTEFGVGTLAMTLRPMSLDTKSSLTDSQREALAEAVKEGFQIANLLKSMQEHLHAALPKWEDLT